MAVASFTRSFAPLVAGGKEGADAGLLSFLVFEGLTTTHVPRFIETPRDEVILGVFLEEEARMLPDL